MFRPTAIAALLLTSTVIRADDWPQWMGTNRDDVWAETGIVEKLPAGAPKVLWKAPVGGGYSGPAVAGGKVFVTDKVLKAGAADPKDPFDAKTPVPTSERVLCFDAKTGKELWKHEYDVTYQVSYPAGPRCTPTVHGGKVYTLGAMGHLVCLDANDGPKKVHWQKHFPTDYGVKTPIWGFTGHPIVHKNLLICLVGGDGSTVVAFDKDTGKEAWKALSTTEPGYNTPTLIDAGGVKQLVVWTPKAVYGLNPDSGARYWDEPLEPAYGMSIMTPQKSGDHLFVAGIGGAGVVLELAKDKPGVKVVWKEGTAKGGDPKAPKDRGLYPVNMTPLIDNGVIYGADQPGVFRAVDLKTGKRLWSTFRPVFGEEKDEDFAGGASGTVFLTKNGGRYFGFAETGDLIVAKLSPKGYEEVSRAKLLAPTGAAFGRKVVWSHPAYANKCVFARNDKELVCASLAAE